MRRTILFGIAIVFAFGALSTAGAAEKKLKVLLFTGGEIHDGKGIGDVIEGVLAKDERFAVTRVFNDLDCLVAPKLDPFDVIILHYTVGTISEAQKRGLMNAVASGKGFVGFHSTADSFRDDPDWRAFVGGHFITHPAYRQFQVSVTEEKSSITAGIAEFMITDEQYILDYDSRVRVLANGLFKGRAVPAIWTKPWGKGRVFYMSFGHDPNACKQEVFQTLLVRSILWAGKASGD